MNSSNRSDPILRTAPLDFPWHTQDPFLACVHHVDDYPAGNSSLGPAVSLEGRHIGQNFAGKDGWRMYHGEVVPGFPQHPHRGFETVTFVREGLIDHSDSLGATVRYGNGDVQWLTAGAGIRHAEMFPLLEREKPNRLEFFQIWLNLPARSKFVPPNFSMLWNRDIPRHRPADGVEVTVVAGEVGGAKPPSPPVDSWAADAAHEVAIWLVTLAPGASWTLPPTRDPRVTRTLYFFDGQGLEVAGQSIGSATAIELAPDLPVAIRAVEGHVEMLLLQGRPIGEPVVQRGPFVMNTGSEITAAIQDFRRTGFGAWPFAADEPVHPRERGRFVRHRDGREAYAPQ